MHSWAEGYLTEIEYTHGYYRELAPSLQRFAVLLAGYAPPDGGGAYLELGFGQGLSATLHAAATACQVWGTDFNPTQAAQAQSLAKAAGLDARLLDESFAELAGRGDLPRFDFISAHGVWSWISDENRSHIASILRRHLAVGGIGYVGYNSLPGWGAALPLRHLLTLHAEVAGSQTQGVAGRIDAALAFAQRMVDKNAAYFRANPAVVEQFKAITGQARQYVAHEYFNRDWRPMPFSDVAAWLLPAKLEFVASAHLLDHVDNISLTADAQSMMRDIHHPILRESIRDYFVNQLFRRDLFMRGARRLSALDRQEILLDTRFSLLTPIAAISFKITTAVGAVTLNEAVYRPLLEALAKEAYRPRALAQLARDLPELSFAMLVEAITVLAGAGHLHPAQSEDVIALARPRTAALNAELCRRARSQDEIHCLASPVIGTGVPVTRFQQMFILAINEGRKTPEEWAWAAWQTLSAQGQYLAKDGATLEKPEDNLAELTRHARAFAEDRLPILMALGVVD